jgi:SNF2 family DNA or RNA helicase
LSRAKLPKLFLEKDQELAVEKIIGEPTMAALNASLMGTGKTLMATETAIRLGSKTVLVVAPLNTYWGWADTVQRQTDYVVPELRKITSMLDGKKSLADLADGKPGWYFVGREYFRTKDWSKIRPDLAIIDECHFAQNRNSKSFRALKTLNPMFRLSMSGTPAGNRFEGFWAVSRWLWPKHIPKSFWAWVYDWCELEYSAFTKHEIVGEKNPGEFVANLPCYIRLEPSHDLEIVEEIRYVDLLPAQRKIYNKFEKDLVVWLEENPMVAEVPIAARIRLRQITLAVPSIDEDGGVVFAADAKSTKFQALQEIIEDYPDERMLILTDSQKFAKLVADRLNTTTKVAFEWSGTKSQKQREAAKQAFIVGGCRYIVAVIPAIAEGVDGLQDVCSTIVWLSHSDNSLMNQQVFDRIHRRGQKEIVKVFDIVARDTFDDPQRESLLQKRLAMNASLRTGE